MDIYTESPQATTDFNKLKSPETKAIRITSIDGLDYGIVYTISVEDIASIGEDCEGMIIWWKEYSQMEGKYFTKSAAFENYEII